MNELSPIAVLLEDHTDALAGLNALAADAVGLEEAGWPQVKKEVSRRFSEFRQALLRHFQREEQGLYPDAMRMVSEGAPEADIIAGFFRDATEADLVAHTLLRDRLQEIAEMLAQMERPGGDFAQSASDLQTALQFTRELLSRHAEKEETLVFPMLARLLDENQMAAVRDRMAAVK